MSLTAQPARAADFAGRYFGSEGASSSVLEVSARRGPALGFTWVSALGKRSRGLGLSDGDDLLAASVNTGGAAYGLVVFVRSAGGWRGRWITSIDGGRAVGEMAMDGEALPGRHRFSGRSGVGAFAGSVNVAARGPGFQLNFTSAGGVALYRGVGAVRGDRLAVAWSFGGSPALVVYALGARGLDGQRLSLSRGQADATSTPERLAREGVDDTIFPPLLPGSAGRTP